MRLDGDVLEDVRRRYGEAHRRYHTVEHLDEMLAVVRDLADLATDPEAVELATWFHDVVYDPVAPPGSNEAASAAYASAVLERLGADRQLVAETARLIELTAAHAVDGGDANGAVLSDADLSILAASPGRYRRYASDVRAEYAAVDDEAWRAGRSAFLRGLLARPRLFTTERMHAAFDGRARDNLAAELAALGGGEAQA